MHGWTAGTIQQDMLEKTEEDKPSARMHRTVHQEKQSNVSRETFILEEAALTSVEEGMPPQPWVEDFACVLHKYRKERNLAYALRLHDCMCHFGLDAHISLGNHLVPMLAEVGSMCDAQKVFDRLLYRTICSWNSLITGYIKCGESRHALIVYQKMKEDSLQPNGYTFVALLRACAELSDVERGSEIHAEISKKGMLERDLFVGSTLVHMYTKCGSLVRAQEVFDKLPFRNIVSWNALIAGYAKHERGKDALNCFKQMQLEGVSPNAVTFVCSLKACGIIGATDKGREIHAEIARKGLLESNLIVRSSLVDMYAKCGSLSKAQEVFDKLPVRDIVSWTALIAGYAKHDCGREALNCFEQMQLEGLSPNSVTFACSLKACGIIRATDKGRELHAEIAKRGLLKRDLVVGNALVDMYAECGLHARAQEVFDYLPFRDVVSWNALMAGYAKHELAEEALNCFERMRVEGVLPDAISLVCSLKACGSIGAIDKGREIHAEIVREGLVERDLIVGNALMDMYAKCGLLAKAQEVFDKLPVRDVVSWTALMAGYAEHECGKEALNCFEQMQLEGVSPNAVTFLCSLKACGSIGDTDKGRAIHAEISGKGLLESDVVASALIDMYAKCGSLAKAHEVFDKLPVQNEVSWNALITGYAKQQHCEKALQCFERMQLKGVSPDDVTFVCCLKACGIIGAIDKGREIHAEIARKGLLGRNVVVGNALVDMYAKCGLLAKAQEVFDKLPVRDVVSWTALMAGYVKHECGKEALKCFEQMQLEGVSRNAVTFVCGLKACGSVGAIDKGEEIHAEIARKGLLERDHGVGSALVDMYAKCGWLAKAQEVFDKLPVRNLVLWNALISGYAKHEQGEEALNCFEDMQLEGVPPDAVTFVGILNACSHAGLVGKGHMYFDAMSNDYGISPTHEHHTCMVDLLGRAGHLDRATAMIKKMLFYPNLVVWRTMLVACRKWGNVKLGRKAFEHAVQLDEKDASAYVCMYNIYADASMYENANKVKAIRVKTQAGKKPGGG